MRRPQLTLSDHLKKKLRRYLHKIFCTRLAAIDFQQFLKNKMAVTANFFRKYCLTNYSNAVQVMLSRFDVQVSNHNTLLFVLFFEAIKLNQNGRLDGTCKFC